MAEQQVGLCITLNRTVGMIKQGKWFIKQSHALNKLTLTDKHYIGFPFNYIHFQRYNTFHCSHDIVRNSLIFEPGIYLSQQCMQSSMREASM